MTSIVHGQIDLLPSFDLRIQNFRINVELSTDYHSHTQKRFSSQEVITYNNKNVLGISYGSLGVLRTQEKIVVMKLQLFGFVRNYNFMTTKIILNINETV